jgi:hypothetical protein
MTRVAKHSTTAIKNDFMRSPFLVRGRSNDHNLARVPARWDHGARMPRHWHSAGQDSVILPSMKIGRRMNELARSCRKKIFHQRAFRSSIRTGAGLVGGTIHSWRHAHAAEADRRHPDARGAKQTCRQIFAIGHLSILTLSRPRVGLRQRFRAASPVRRMAVFSTQVVRVSPPLT